MTNARVVNVLSVDVEDYFQVETFHSTIRPESWASYPSRIERNTCQLLELLADCHVHATFFVLGWIAERYPRLVRDIVSAGHEVGSHGYGHQLISRQDRAAFRADVARAKTILEQTAGSPVMGYRAPTFSIVRDTLWALDVLIEEGYRYDSSLFPVHHDRYGMPGADPFVHWIDRGSSGGIVEFPPLTLRLAGVVMPAAGGGYLRLFPVGLIRWAVARHNRQGQAAMLYVHPWEIDPAQPRLPGPWIGRLRHYLNLSRTAGRLRTLAGSLRLAPAWQVLVSAYGHLLQRAKAAPQASPPAGQTISRTPDA